MKKIGLIALIFIFLFCGTNAFAVSFGFEDIVESDALDITGNISLEVEEKEGGRVTFTFENEGPDDSFIAGIYWDFGELELLEVPDEGAFVEDSQNVNFSDKKTKNVPEGNEIGFDADYSALAKRPGSGKQGIDVGESATFSFLINSDFDDVIEALTDGSLRIAIKLQGIGDDGEDGDSYLAYRTPVPEPPTMLLLGAGLIGLAGLGRKKLFKKK